MQSDRPIGEWLETGWMQPSGGRISLLDPSRFLTISPSATSRDFAPVVVAPMPSTIVETLREAPFENGEAHPLDDAFSVALHDDPTGLAQAVTDAWEVATVRRPDLLLLLSRLPEHLAERPFLPLVRQALASSRRVERDAAIRVLEAWGSPGARGVLEAHTELDPRLGDYLRRVIEGVKRRRPG